MKNKKLSELEAITILLISFSLFLYEIGFCNLKNIVCYRTYNVSFFRIVCYSIIIFCIIKFGKKLKEEAEKLLKSKKKLIYVYLVSVIIFTIYAFFNIKHIYTFILMIFLDIFGLIFILYLTKDHVKNIIVTSLTIGFLFTLTTDVFHPVDEKKHFLTSLNVAVGNFNFIEEPLTDETFQNIDFDCMTEDFAMEYFNIYKKLDMKPIGEDQDIFSTPAEYNPVVYIPASIGMNMARFLGGSVGDIFMAGRIANLLTYCFLLIIIFKILPFKKDTFYVMYLMPMAFTLGCCYSIDGLTTGFVGIFIAYTFKLYKEGFEKINIKKFLILLSLMVLVLTCKNGSYLGICLTVFILPVIKIIKNNKKILNTMVIIIAIAVAIGIYEGSKVAQLDAGDDRVKGSSPTKQIEYLLDNPTHIFKVYTNYTRQELFWFNWYNGFNIKMFYGKYYSVIAFFMFIYVLYTAITDGSFRFKNKDKIVMFLTFAATYFVTTFVLYLAYTKVGSATINGYQARYLIPILPLLLCCMNSKKVIDKEDSVISYSKTALISGIFIMADVLCMITT